MANPKNLKCPFTWEERRPLIHEGVLFVPTYYFAHDAWGKKPLFSNDAPIHLEFCSGNGDWIINKAKEHPEIHWVAVEKRFDRVRKIWSKRANHNLNNLLIVCGEGGDFATHYIEDSAIDKVYINFPDPWPKDKHAKHRIIHPAFVKELKRIAKPSCSALFVTDDLPYSVQMEEIMKGSALWKLDRHTKDWENYGPSYFDSLWRKLNRTIHFLEFTPCN